MHQIREAISLDDLLLIPQYSEVRSRADVDTSAALDPHHVFNLPIIASPMDTVTEVDMMLAMNNHGCLAILHRYFDTIEKQVEMIGRVKKNAVEVPVLAAAIGITGDYFERDQELVKVGVTILNLDVAHGHHVMMKEALTKLRAEFNSEVHLMAGAIATPEAYADLSNWGADSVRVGIGGGSICSTRIQTGHGIPTLGSIWACARSPIDWGAKIIADGGAKCPGDVVKYLAGGANFVMAGSLFAGCDETPGEIVKPKDGSPPYMIGVFERRRSGFIDLRLPIDDGQQALQQPAPEARIQGL